jgi:hypothetical protein
MSRASAIRSDAGIEPRRQAHRMQGAPSSFRTVLHLCAEREHFRHGTAGLHDCPIGHRTGCALTQRAIAGDMDRISARRG